MMMADWGQEASTAIGFIKATEKEKATLQKKPHITLKKLLFQ
jgi:hypothetical protein